MNDTGIVGENRNQRNPQEDTNDRGNHGDEKGCFIGMKTLLTGFGKSTCADTVPDNNLCRLTDGNRKNIKQDGDILYVGFRNQFLFGQTVQYDRCNH